MGKPHSSSAYRELGGMLRGIREKNGLTATELARRLGWPLTTISRIENGKRTSTTTDVIQYVVMCGMRPSEIKPIVEFTKLAERKQGYYLSDALCSQLHRTMSRCGSCPVLPESDPCSAVPFA